MTEKKNPPNGKGLSQHPIAKLASHLIDRAEAAKIYLSGELEARRQLLLTLGDVPWRILRYERIIDPERLEYPLGKNRYVRPKTFEVHLKYLTHKCLVLSLDELFTRIENNAEIPSNTVALTFDGGWNDNYVFAAPLLKRYNVPATMFLPSYFIGTKNFPWPDKVAIAMLTMKVLDGPFKPFSFFTESDRAFLAEVSPDGDISLDLIARVVAILMRHSPENRLTALTAFGQILDFAQVDLPADPAFMTWDDVANMSEMPVTFGALTYGNAPVHEIPDEYVGAEIGDAFAAIKEHTKNVTRTFAFPDGIISSEGMHALFQQRITRAVGISGIGDPKQQVPPPLVLGRVPVIEGRSFSTETLACLLWHEMGVPSQHD